MLNKDKFQNKSNTSLQIWSRIETVRIALDLSIADLAELLHMSESELLKLRADKREPTVSSVMAFCDALNIGFSTFMTGDIDTVALVKQFQGEIRFMPEKYTVKANSKKRTVINLLNFIEENFGWERKTRMLRYFQMNEAMFEDPDGDINLRLAVDLSDYLKKIVTSDSVFLDMGKNAVATYKNTEIGKTLENARRPMELFEMMFDGLSEKFVEKNFSWSIVKKGSTGLVIEGLPNPDIFDSLGENYLRTKSGSLIRQGFISSIPEYLGYNDAPISTLKCVSQGDEKTQYLVHLNPEHQKPKFTVVS